MLCDLLVVQDHLVTDVFLYDSSGGPHAIRHLNGRSCIWLLEVLLDMLLIAAVIVCMLVVADSNDLQHKELSLDLPNLMKRQDVDSLFRQLCRKLR